VTRLTDNVLANVHGDLRRRLELHPANNQLIAEILNRMDEITVDGYDADAAAAAMFAYSAVLGSHKVTAPAGATHQDVVEYLATMATLTGQSLHAQTHAEAEPEPQTGPRSWPPDRRERIPVAVVGTVPTPYHLEALRQYQAARGLRGLISVAALTTAEVNRAVTWWNHRAAMLDLENPR